MYSCAYSGNINTFTYGADGLRRASVTNGTRTDFAIDGTMAVREMRDINSDGILESIATYFNGMYKRDDTNGTLRWYIYDGLGSVLAEVDPSGNVTAGRKYDVYGLVRSGQAGISKHKFVGKLGHVSEDETGLVYMRARYMDPVLGKFLSEDMAEDGGNWYSYCNNNPVDFLDQDGKAANDLIDSLLYFLGAPFALDLIGVLLIGLALVLKNPFLLVVGLIALVIGVIWSIDSYTKYGAPIMKDYMNRIRKEAGEDSIINSIELMKSAGKGLEFAGWAFEMLYYLDVAQDPF